MDNEESIIQKFSGEIRKLFLENLIEQEKIVQKRGDFFVTVMRETGSQTAFSYQVRYQGKFHNIGVSYLSKGEVKIETSSGSKQNCKISELNKTKVREIFVGSMKEIERETDKLKSSREQK